MSLLSNIKKTHHHCNRMQFLIILLRVLFTLHLYIWVADALNVTETSPPTSVSYSPSFEPSHTPSSKPILFQSTGSPFISPKIVNTPSPVAGTEIHSEEVSDVSMLLAGMSPLNNENREKFEDLTEEYIEDFYNNHTSPEVKTLQNSLFNVTVDVKVTDMDPPFEQKKSAATEELKVIYDLNINYRNAFRLNATQDDILREPFNNIVKRKNYVQFMQERGKGDFESLTHASLPIIEDADDDETESTSLNLFLILGPVVGGIVVLFFIVFLYRRSRNYKHAGPSDNSFPDVEDNTIQTNPQAGVMTDESLQEFEHRSIGTNDPDYNPGGVQMSGGVTVSSAGASLGTFGSTAPQSRFSATDSMLTPAINSSAGHSIFSDDNSFQAHLRGPGQTMPREEVFHVIAPPGKLGVVIDTPDNGAPVVYNIKESCPIADQLQVGDKVVAVDGEDVRSMTAVKVSRLISEKSANPERNFRIIRNC